MNIGSLYTVKKYFWLLFPTKALTVGDELHDDGHAPAIPFAAFASIAADYWSRRYNCEVTYFSPDSIIIFLENDGKFKKVLTSEGLIGWIWFAESYNECFEEVKTEQ